MAARISRLRLATHFGVLLTLALALVGCHSDHGPGNPFVAPPAPQQGPTALDPFYIGTLNYFTLYTSSTRPFSTDVQYADHDYPVSVAYDSPAPVAGFQLPLESERAVAAWAAADPRVTVVSGAAPDTSRIRVHLVETIDYNGSQNIIGLTRMLVGGPQPGFEVFVATRDALTGLPMTVADLEKTLTHELGHTLGLGHSPDSRDLMYYRANGQQGATFRTFLTYGDAVTVWTTLSNRHINWVPDRPAISYPAQPVVTATSRVAHVRDADGVVVCVYRR
jgi:hypothetical protein